MTAYSSRKFLPMACAIRSSNPIARLRPIPSTDRFELFYWSNAKGGWKTFGNMGRMKLMLTSAHEIVESDPMFPVPRAR